MFNKLSFSQMVPHWDGWSDMEKLLLPSRTKSGFNYIKYECIPIEINPEYSPSLKFEDSFSDLLDAQRFE